MSESALQRRILSWALSARRAHGVCIHGTPFGRVGTPDLILCVRGEMVLVETKLPDGRLTPKQIHEQKLWIQAGATVLVPRSFEQFAKTVEG